MQLSPATAGHWRDDWVHTLRQLTATACRQPWSGMRACTSPTPYGIALAVRSGAALLPRLRQALASEALAPGQGSAVLGGGRPMPAAAAAFVNAALAHALDFDDIHDTARLHPTPVTLAAALAIGSNASAPHTSGHTLLEAVVIGNETMCRLGRACAPTGQGPASGWSRRSALR